MLSDSPNRKSDEIFKTEHILINVSKVGSFRFFSYAEIVEPETPTFRPRQGSDQKIAVGGV